jgi:hypothetical protein
MDDTEKILQEIIAERNINIRWTYSINLFFKLIVTFLLFI